MYHTVFLSKVARDRFHLAGWSANQKDVKSASSTDTRFFREILVYQTWIDVVLALANPFEYFLRRVGGPRRERCLPKNSHISRKFRRVPIRRLWDHGIESELQLNSSAMLYCTTDKLFRPTVKALGKVKNLGKVVEKNNRTDFRLGMSWTGLDIQFHTSQQ